MRSLTGGSAGLPDAFGQTGSRFGKSCSVPGEPLLAYLSGGLCPRKQLRPSSDVKITTKGWKTLATTHVDKVQWHGWAQQPVRQKSSKNARVYKFLLRANVIFGLFSGLEPAQLGSDLAKLPETAMDDIAAIVKRLGTAN